MPGRSVLVDKTPARDPACRPTHPVPGHPDLTLKRQCPLPYSRDVGTFGNGPFDSDDARDLVDQLADQPGRRREVLDRLFFRVRDRPGLLDWEFSLLVRLPRRPQSWQRACLAVKTFGRN